MVDAEDSAQEEVKCHPCCDENAGFGARGGETHGGEEEGDGGEEEAGFLVGDEGEEKDADEGREEVKGLRRAEEVEGVWGGEKGVEGFEEEGDGGAEEEGQVYKEVRVARVEAVGGEVGGGEVVEEGAEGGWRDGEEGVEREVGGVEGGVD